MKKTHWSDDVPEKYGFFEYYTRGPRSVVRAIATGIFGMWYCKHCNKYHGRRVIKYINLKYPLKLHACSKGGGVADE
jgi:hypothetical protein